MTTPLSSQPSREALGKMALHWRDIPDYEGHYIINSIGDIMTVKFKRARPLKTFERVKGYMGVDLFKNDQKKCLYVHRLVAMAFIENPMSLAQINHIDGNPANNSVTNLEWCTGSENQLHKIRVLRRDQGSSRSSAKLTEVDVGVIVRDRSAGQTCKEIGLRYGVADTTISRIVRGKRWVHVSR